MTSAQSITTQLASLNINHFKPMQSFTLPITRAKDLPEKIYQHSIAQDRKDWDNQQALFEDQHTHKFESKASFDPETDEAYYFGQCACGETEI